MSPSAASEKIRNGIRMAENQYSDPTNGIATKATAISTAKPMRSWRIGKIWLSAT
ncbi:hypothetical protein D9M73_256370 [compost metagenome]